MMLKEDTSQPMYHSVSQTISKPVSATYTVFPTAEGVRNENYFLMTATATGETGTFTITADQNNHVLRITADGNLVVTNAGESPEVGIDALIAMH